MGGDCTKFYYQSKTCNILQQPHLEKKQKKNPFQTNIFYESEGIQTTWWSKISLQGSTLNGMCQCQSISYKFLYSYIFIFPCSWLKCDVSGQIRTSYNQFSFVICDHFCISAIRVKEYDLYYISECQSRSPIAQNCLDK